ncbi:hypothetical protein F4V89_23040 [Neorhizobium galegae]|nr:hypothetical protein F4V89_23040 [Neorhizobium galegae]
MAILRLFGLRLPLVDRGVLEVGKPIAAGVTVGDWNTTIVRNTGVLTISAWLNLYGDFTLAVHLELTAESDASGNWSVRTGLHPQRNAFVPVFRLYRGAEPYPGTINPGGNPPLAFEAGPYQVYRSRFAKSSVFADDGFWISFGSGGGISNDILNGEALPFTLRPGSGGVRVDLSSLSVDLSAQFLECETRAQLTAGNPAANVSFFTRNWVSQPTQIALGSGSYTSEMVYAPVGRNQQLPVSVDLLDRSGQPSANNPLLPAQALTGALRLLCTRMPNQHPIQIDGAWMEPLQGGNVELSANFLAHPGGSASRWSLSDRVPLHVRTGHVGAPSTFVIAPIANGLPAKCVTSAASLHGPITAAEFQLSGDAKLQCTEREAQANVAAHINPAIASEISAPFLTEERSFRVVHAKPGQTYRSANNVAQADIVTYGFPGTRLGIPLTPDSQLALYPALRARTYAELNTLAASSRPIPLQEATHETLLVEGSPAGKNQTLTINRLFGGAVPTFAKGLVVSSGAALRLEQHTVRRSYGAISVDHPVSPENALDYVLLFENDVVLTGSFKFRPAPEIDEIVLAGKPPEGVGSNNKLLGVLKLSTAYRLEEILAREQTRIAQQAGNWDWRSFLQTTLTDTAIKSSGWLGMLLFEIPIDIARFTVLNSMVPNTLKLSYLALTPQKNGAEFSVGARVRLDPPIPNPDAYLEGQEVRFRLRILDMIWRDSNLVTFRTEATLAIQSIFGVTNANPQPEVRIVGSYDQPSNTFRFLGELPYEQPIFPAQASFGPIKQVYVRSAEIIESHGAARIHLDGRVETKPFTMAGINWFQGGSSPDLSFRRLGLVLPSAQDLNWRWLRIDYPSMRLNIDGPQFRLLDILELKIAGLGVDWPNLDVPHIPWGELADIWQGARFDKNLPAFNLKLRLELMRLPELVARSLERLRFDFTLGFNLSPWDESKLKVALTAVDFKKLNLELLRFLTIKADDVDLTSQVISTAQGSQAVPRLDLINVSVAILDYTVIQSLDAVIYSLPDGRTCFACRIKQPAKTGLLNIDWVLIGQNIMIPSGLAEDLLSIKPATNNAALAASINTVWDDGASNNGFLPLADHSGRGEWIFGAGFDLFSDFVVGKFLFQDHTYYGLALDGTWLRDWFGWDFAISVLYVRGERPEEDRFVVSMRIPSVTLPAFHFFGGVIGVDVDLRGRFLLDIGFPWMRSNGSRDWDRMFGAIVTPFQGTGGAYIANGLSKAGLPNGVVLMAGGVAVQFGLGGAFGGGAFRVWATAGFYFITEGEFYLQNKQLIGADLAGSAGILVRAGAELNWWIISVRIELTISAECRIVARWGMTYSAIARAQPLALAATGIKMEVSFVLYASAEASACIGGGWFKICKGISVTVPLRYDCHLTLA